MVEPAKERIRDNNRLDHHLRLNSDPLLSKNFTGRDSRREAESSHHSGRCFRGAKLSHGETVFGKAKGRPPQGRAASALPPARSGSPAID